MEINPQVVELIGYIQKIYNQGELEPFIDLVQTQNRILLCIALKHKVKPSELSDDLRISRPNVTSSLKSLEEFGYVSRMINPQNRREVYVTLTKEGQEKFETIIQTITYMFSEWFRILGPEESSHVLKILKLSGELEIIGEGYKKAKI